MCWNAPSISFSLLLTAEKHRVVSAVYFDPLTRLEFFDYTRHGYPAHLHGKSGTYYFPPVDHPTSAPFRLTPQDEAFLARAILGPLYRGPADVTPTVAMRYLYEQRPIIQPPAQAAPSSNPLLVSSAAGAAAIPLALARRGRYSPEKEQTVVTALKSLDVEREIQLKLQADDDPDWSDDDDMLGEKEREEKRKNQIRFRRLERFFRVELGYVPEENEEERTTMLAFRSVQLDTACQYCSCLSQIVKNGFELTLDGYNQFLVGPGQKLKGPTTGQYFTAFKHFSRVMGWWNPIDRSKAITDALKREKVEGEKVRGSITEDMVEDLLKTKELLDGKHELARNLFILLSATGCRLNQLVHLRESDCKKDPEEEGVWRVSVRANHKGRQGKNASTKFEVHFTNPRWGHEIERILAANRQTSRDRDPHVCPGWHTGSGMQERKLLKELAAKLKWSPELAWVLHSFRNGAAYDAFMKCASDSDLKRCLAVKAKTGHLTLEMIRHYAVPNSERLRYAQMRLEECVLRATGVVMDGLTGQTCTRPGRFRPKLVSVSSLRNFGDKDEFKKVVKDLKM